MDKDITTPKASRARRLTAEQVVAIREVFDECLVGPGTARHPVTGEPITPGELKQFIGDTRRPALSRQSVHLIVTGQTHRDAGGPVHPVERPTREAGVPARVVAVRELYAIGRPRVSRRAARADRATLVSRTLVDGDGSSHVVEHVRLVTVDSSGVVVDPGRPLAINGRVSEGDRELVEGVGLEPLCDPAGLTVHVHNALDDDDDDDDRTGLADGVAR